MGFKLRNQLLFFEKLQLAKTSLHASRYWPALITISLSFFVMTLPAEAQHTITDNGDFVLELKEATRESDQWIAEEVKERKENFQSILDGLNEALSLNHTVRVAFISWPDEQPNAAYLPSEKAITIGYGMIPKIMELMGDEDDWGDTDPILVNVEHTMLHEIAHALIHVNDINLPQHVNEERASDQLAFYVMSMLYEDRLEDLFAVAEAYVWREEKERTIQSEHLPNEERGIDYLCWIVGREPDFEEMFTEEEADILMGRNCTAEYTQLEETWNARLSPAMKR